jgi:CspA family cold shock protein
LEKDVQPESAQTKTESTIEGTVKWFSDHKGFGYITSPGLKTDAFVHYTEIDEKGPVSLQPGMKVAFEAVEGPKGWIASRVRESEA